MRYLPILPALLLPLIAAVGLIARGRQAGGGEVVRRRGRYLRNNLLLGVILAGLALVFGSHR
jgi:hypothetical protein